MPTREITIRLWECKEMVEWKRRKSIHLLKVKMFAKLYPDSNGTGHSGVRGMVCCCRGAGTWIMDTFPAVSPAKFSHTIAAPGFTVETTDADITHSPSLRDTKTAIVTEFFTFGSIGPSEGQIHSLTWRVDIEMCVLLELQVSPVWALTWAAVDSWYLVVVQVVEGIVP